ncbi:alpha/beta-hydrolase [Martensiomyces pterosporus]|nr:alpha/beta-hydrolase [Martensiomyces pterosporus]
MTQISLNQQPLRVHELDRTDVESYIIPGGKVVERFFDCPLDYSQPDNGQKVRVFARHIVPLGKEDKVHELPFILYLQGGPGFETRFPGSVKGGWYSTAIKEGYQILLLDQRGTGLSSAINADSLHARFSSTEEKVQYVTKFRADSIVRDCEHIREIVCEGRADADSRKFALLGQSFGGFCITTYLSLFPKSISKAFITGGVPPLVDGPDAVYQATYRRMIHRNKQYYEKFPADVERVRRIMQHLNENKVLLPDGGNLSPRRFQQLGISFGRTGGFDSLHQLVFQASDDLETIGRLTNHTLSSIAATQSFDSNPIYCILHEAIYCQSGNASLWSAHRVREDDPQSPVYFTGETVYPWMLDDYPELRRLRDVAQGLAEYKGWGQLYDVGVLRNNTTPVAGVSYYNDMFVDFYLSEQTAHTITGFRQWVTNEYHHNGLSADPRVITYLVDLLRGDITDL